MQRNLTLFVLLGLILGVAVGYVLHSQQPSAAWPEIAANFKLITDVFLRLIKMIIAPLVFSTLVVGIAHMGGTGSLGRVGVRTLLWFITASIFSLLLGLAIVHLLQPGVGLQLHYHTGPAQVYTFQGCWFYREYPDQQQTAGSYLYEPGGSVHTFFTPEDNTEDTVALIIVDGANVNFNEDGSFHSILDAVSLHYLTETVSAAQGTTPVFVHGGTAGVVKP